MVNCKECGKEISAKAPACPNCGAKNKKPIFKRFWFWLIVIFAIFAFLGNTDPYPEKDEEKTTINYSEFYNNLTTTEGTIADSDISDDIIGDEEEPSTEPTTEATTKSNLVNGMRPEFKAAMDSYEAFFDEYCEFMEKYSKNPSDLSILTDYTSFMSKYTDYMEKLEKWESEDMNDAELKYYTEVTLRIEKKLLEAAY